MSDGAVHSKIGASSMYRWSNCPGSVRMSEGIESKSSVYAEEGTLAHAYAADLLEIGKHPSGASAEIIESVMVYVETVRSDAGTNPIQVEVKFDLSNLFPGMFGTSDAVVYDPISKILRVYDYKHGSGLIVEVSSGGVGNSQLMYYALGALLSTNQSCSDVELVIVQPRANHPDGPVRRFRFKSFDLVEFSADLIDAAKKTTDPNAPLVAGDWCRFCPAAGICPELGNKALRLAKQEFSPAIKYDPRALSETLSKISLLEDYAKSVREFAYAEAEHGRCPPGWKLVAKRPVRKWRDEEQVSIHWKQVFGEAAFDYKLKSPAQIEKLMLSKGTGGAGKKAVANECISVSSGLTLVEESDPRPKALASAESEFSVIEQTTEELFT